MPQLPAPRVPPLSESEWTGVHRDLVTRFADDGVDPLLASLLQLPEMVEAVMPMTHYVTEESTLSPPHRLLLALRTTWLERSDAVWATHAARAARSESPVIAAVLGDAGHGDQVSGSLRQLADELEVNISVSDSTWTSLAGEHDLTWMMDAVETVAHVSFLCCLARSFGVDQGGPRTPGTPGALGTLPDVPYRRPAPHADPALTTARIEPVQGDQIAVLRTFARHPVMTAARRPRADFVNRVSSLTPHDRETLILRIGWNCRSEYEWAKHVGSVGHARQHGVDPELVAVGPTAPGVSDHDALLMRIADELNADSMVSDATWKTLLEQHDLPWLMSAVFTVSSYRSTSMSLNTYGVQLEPGDERFPRRQAT